MTFDSVSLSNTFLACFIFINLAILALLYQFYKKK
jgi:hypothetical protein